jgi:predicted TIM-barrel fold metal-dependent hydrolase
MILVRYINSILQDKVLFGSDWPVITPDRWLSDFAKLEGECEEAVGYLGSTSAPPPLSRPTRLERVHQSIET